MATINATFDRDTVPGAILVTWAGMATNDVGAGVPIGAVTGALPGDRCSAKRAKRVAG